MAVRLPWKQLSTGIFVVKMLQILWPKSIFLRKKKREFCLKTQFGQSLQVDVSVIILAEKKIETNSFFNKFEFFRGRNQSEEEEKGFSRAAKEESVKKRERR